MRVYRYPEYYDLAFSFRDIPRELDFFESAIKRFSRVNVRSVLELASGTAPYLEEWNRRGYRYCGLDLSSAMVRFARRKAEEKGISATIHLGDLRTFDARLGRFDLAYILLGSLYTRSNAEFLGHLERVASVLSSGGLYLLDGVIWFKLLGDKKQSWTMRRKGVSVRTTFVPEVIDAAKQTYYEHLTFAVNDHGRKRVIEGKVKAKIIFPQEFLALVELSRKFEFIGWYNNFSFAEQVAPKGRQIVILRKI